MSWSTRKPGRIMIQMKAFMSVTLPEIRTQMLIMLSSLWGILPTVGSSRTLGGCIMGMMGTSQSPEEKTITASWVPMCIPSSHVLFQTAASANKRRTLANHVNLGIIWANFLKPDKIKMTFPIPAYPVITFTASFALTFTQIMLAIA